MGSDLLNRIFDLLYITFKHNDLEYYRFTRLLARVASTDAIKELGRIQFIRLEALGAFQHPVQIAADRVLLLRQAFAEPLPVIYLHDVVATVGSQLPEIIAHTVQGARNSQLLVEAAVPSNIPQMAEIASRMDANGFLRSSVNNSNPVSSFVLRNTWA